MITCFLFPQENKMRSMGLASQTGKHAVLCYWQKALASTFSFPRLIAESQPDHIQSTQAFR